MTLIYFFPYEFLYIEYNFASKDILPVFTVQKSNHIVTQFQNMLVAAKIQLFSILQTFIGGFVFHCLVTWPVF